MKKTCFVACPIGEEGSQIRKDADALLNQIIKPACDDMEVFRSDLEYEGNITKGILRHLETSTIVIADLTDMNPNVLYEVGYRHALGFPLILLRKKEQKIPFNLQNIRSFEYSLRVDEAPEAIKFIKNRIEYLLSDKNKPNLVLRRSDIQPITNDDIDDIFKKVFKS